MLCPDSRGRRPRQELGHSGHRVARLIRAWSNQPDVRQNIPSGVRFDSLMPTVVVPVENAQQLSPRTRRKPVHMFHPAGLRPTRPLARDGTRQAGPTRAGLARVRPRAACVRQPRRRRPKTWSAAEAEEIPVECRGVVRGDETPRTRVGGEYVPDRRSWKRDAGADQVADTCRSTCTQIRDGDGAAPGHREVHSGSAETIRTSTGLLVGGARQASAESGRGCIAAKRTHDSGDEVQAEVCRPDRLRCSALDTLAGRKDEVVRTGVDN